MKSSSEIEEICKKYNIENYTINDDDSIDVDGEVYLGRAGLTELPLDFNKVTGDFNCSSNFLTTLKGSPKYVGDTFNCSDNELVSLKYCPEEVIGNFRCEENKLTSLEYGPIKVGIDLYYTDNKLRDLYGISNHISGYLFIRKNPIASVVGTLISDIHFIRAFNSYRVIKDDKVVLRRLKYVMEAFDMKYDLEKIKEYYEII